MSDSFMPSLSYSKTILDLILEYKPNHGESLAKHFKDDQTPLQALDKALLFYMTPLEIMGVSLVDVTKAYLKLNDDMQNQRIRFLTKGEYCRGDFDDIYQNVYSDNKAMMSYMLGLLLSQFLWPHHYKLNLFYKKILAKHAQWFPQGLAVLEIGPGHGFHFLELLNTSKENLSGVLVDLSPVSLALTKKIIEGHPRYADTNISFYESKIEDFEAEDRRFDLIVAGEVLEHLSEPGELLKNMKALLNDGGYIYLTTCANCPAVDHLTHFPCVCEVKKLCQQHGLEVVEECIAPSIIASEEKIKTLKADVSYAALLKKF
jgi:2-polyprenyl-3-methyl-5-hydroxy-6-metoxy-1,4-benzoquinol methylase